MPFAGILLALIDVTCIAHIRQTGRPDYWMWVVLMLPGVGALAYLLYEVLPNMGSSHTVKRIIKRIQPSAEMRERLAEVEACGSMANKVALADECISTGQFDSAINLYMSCKTGIYEHDPTLLYGLGEANFYKGDFPEARRWLQDLMSREAFFRAGEARLLYARTLEGAGDDEAALTQYEALSQQYAGEEPRARMGALLVRMGRGEAARQTFEAVIKNTGRAPKHIQRMQKEWIDQARAGLKELAGEAVH
jgi:hypothetical protein